MRVYLRPRRLKAKEAHGPPLDKQVPEVQRNGQCIKSKKTADKTSLSTVLQEETLSFSFFMNQI